MIWKYLEEDEWKILADWKYFPEMGNDEDKAGFKNEYRYPPVIFFKWGKPGK